jgi:predicted thioredoxin/glutaredoxin
MQSRTVTEFSSITNKIEYALPDCDVDSFLRFARATRTTRCILVDGEVVHSGLFDPTSIAKIVKSSRPTK